MQFIAVHLWRHKLMHTAGPRQVTEKRTGVAYKWLLHWWEHLPREQHFTFGGGSPRVLNLGLVYLIEDLQKAWAAFAADVRSSQELRANLEQAQAELESYII